MGEEAEALGESEGSAQTAEAGLYGHGSGGRESKGPVRVSGASAMSLDALEDVAPRGE